MFAMEKIQLYRGTPSPPDSQCHSLAESYTFGPTTELSLGLKQGTSLRSAVDLGAMKLLEPQKLA